MKLKITLLFSLFVGLLNAQTWENIGITAPFDGITADGQGLVVLDNGHPVVAYIDQNTPSIIKIVEWNGANWVPLPSISPLLPSPFSDLQFIKKGNTLYCGVGTTSAPGYPYNVFRLDGVAWTDLDDGSLTSMSYTSGTVKLEVSDQTDDLVLTFSDYGGGSGDLPNAYKYDGTSWDLNYGIDLNNIFQMDPTTSNETNSFSSKIFHNGPNTYYLSYQTEPFGGAYIEGGNQTKNGGFDELRLYRFDAGTWQVLPFSGEDFIQNNPLNTFEIAGNSSGGFPYIAYIDNASPNTIQFQEMDGIGNYNPLINFSLGSSISSVGMAVDNVNLPYVAASDGTGSNKVIHYNGTTWDQIGTTDFSTNLVSEIDVEVFQASNKVYVLYQTDIGSKMKVYNNTPQHFSSPTTANICQDAGLSEVISDLNITDQDNDSVYIVSITSNNLTVIPNANITATRTIAYSPTSNENHFKIEVTPLAGQTGFVTLTITYSDGFGNQNITNYSVQVNGPPTVNAGPDQVGCEGDSFTLSGSGATSYVWNNSVTDGIAFTPLSGTYTYTCIGTDSDGCIATDAAQIIVNPLPTFTTTTTDITCNSNGDGQLNFSGLTPATSYNIEYTYLSNPNFDTQTSDGSGNVSVAGLPAGSYSDIRITNNVTSCVSLTNAGPYTIVEPSLITIFGQADQTYCEGTSVTLNGNGNGGTGTLSYTWNNSVIDGVAFTPAVSSLVYTLTATDLNGCFGTDNVLTITVNATTPVFTLSPTDPTTCGGVDGAISLTGLLLSTNYDVTYNDGSVQGPTAMTSDASGNILISGLGAASYSNFDVTNANACTTSDAGPISLSDPGAPFVNPPNSQSLCANGSFNSTLFTGTASAIFNWTNDNTTIGIAATGTGDILGFTGLNSGVSQEVATISVTPTLGGCTGVAQTFTLTVDPLDDANFAYATNSFCLNSSNPIPTSIATAGGTFTYITNSGGPTLILNSAT